MANLKPLNPKAYVEAEHAAWAAYAASADRCPVCREADGWHGLLKTDAGYVDCPLNPSTREVA